MSRIIDACFIGLFISISVFVGCLENVNDTVYGESIIVTYGGTISCDDWQDGRQWKKNGVIVLTDDSCKGMGSSLISPKLEVWGAKKGDVFSYVVAEQELCSVEIAETHLKQMEATCYFDFSSGVEQETPLTHQNDTDGDGVADLDDACPGTLDHSTIDMYGCAPYQIDLDDDGVPDIWDLCNSTQSGVYVDKDGCAFGLVFTWGPGQISEDPIATGVIEIVGTEIYGMAGLRADGSVVVWGQGHQGFDEYSADLQEGVVSIHNYKSEFAVLKQDGSVISWGDCFRNLCLSFEDVAEDLSDGVKEIFVASSFIALKEDGGLVIWGGSYDGDTGDFHEGIQLTGEVESNIVDVLPSNCGALMILENGSYITYWDLHHKVDFQDFDIPLGTDIEKFFCYWDHAVVLTSDGRIHTAGRKASGIHEPDLVMSISNNVTDLIRFGGRYVALKTDGSIIPFPESAFGKYSPTELSFISIEEVNPTWWKELSFGFIARTANHGIHYYGVGCGDLTPNETAKFLLENEVIKFIHGGDYCIASTKENGNIIWGESHINENPEREYLYDSIPLELNLSSANVSTFHAVNNNFLVLTEEGQIFVWGDGEASEPGKALADITTRYNQNRSAEVMGGANVFVILFH